MLLILMLLGFNLSGLIFLIVISRKKSPLLDDKFLNLEKNQQRVIDTVKDEIARNRNELSDNSRKDREELTRTLDTIRDAVSKSLELLRNENSQKLEQMRLTVDEKLHETLEKRLGEKFNIVSKHLESVQQGLGEMRSLASGVGDLKKVLTNVKTRGIWGEVSLNMLLEQILTPQQYEANVRTKQKSNDAVEFAIKLPGKTGEKNDFIWLPIDAKFPQEDYLRLIAAQDAGNKEEAESCVKALETRIKGEAKDIRDKYLDPPHTTDFAIMFLPIEGLYAEVLRRPTLAEILQRDFRVVIAGPTTLAALLNSLQMGFRTLAVEKRSSEVWQVLSVVKQEFAKFGDILEKTKEKLDQASKTIDLASSKTRTIQSKLNKAESLPDHSGIDIALPAADLSNNDEN
jgi:DNA recombination protein RmuC